MPHYWWVNQNQTFEQETRGGYMWSPKRKANDQRNPFYEFMREVAPVLPEKYAPLRPNGHGLQSVYLTSVPILLAEVLLGLLGPGARALANATVVADRSVDDSRSPAQGQIEWEEHLVRELEKKPIQETEKTALVLARRGQGLFKQRVQAFEKRCRITGVDRLEHLRASHCKPWRDADDA